MGCFFNMNFMNPEIFKERVEVSEEIHLINYLGESFNYNVLKLNKQLT